MSITHLILAAEPASIFYMVTGAAGFAFAGLRRSRGTQSQTSIAMLFSKRKSRTMLASLDLL